LVVLAGPLLGLVRQDSLVAAVCEYARAGSSCTSFISVGSLLRAYLGLPDLKKE
jgi:hypothetical protein